MSLTDDEIRDGFCKYIPYFKVYEDISEQLNIFLKARADYFKDPIPFKNGVMKNKYQSLYCSLKAEWVARSITEEDFYYLTGLCKYLD